MSITAVRSITPDPQVTVELITTDKATEYLGRNTHNRNIRLRTVDAYVADIATGNWQWNGEGIKFAEDGTLLDGQHRLMAIVESGVSVRMLVIRSLQNDTQHTMDTGVRRSFTDVLRLRNELNCTALAATVRGVFYWDRGIRRFGGSGGLVACTNTQLLEVLGKYPWLRDGQQLLSRVGAHSGMPISVSGPLWYAFTNLDTSDAEFFFQRLSSDENHSAGEPIFALRKALQNSRDDKRGTRNVTLLAAWSVKAWNKYRDGDEARVLKWTPGGANPEKFPEPK